LVFLHVKCSLRVDFFREETEQLLLDLFLEEKEAKAQEEVRKKEEKRAAMRQEMIQANEAQKSYKAQQELEVKAEEDVRFCVYVLPWYHLVA
jgi:hypothetical protein